ncbi:chromo domain-containing protein [Diplocarpon rosae]|nr:chromo domain-containing protein [Diplocarpon rosae]
MASASQCRDEDDISVTSTVSDQYSADDEFEVDRILAEKGGTQSGKFYLISWLDYPIEKATWEPANHVGPECLDAWKIRMQREKDGREQPFDIEGWEVRVKKAENEKADRKRRREAKRKRLRKANLQAFAEKVASKPSDGDASCSEATEEYLVEYDRGMKIKGPARRKKTAVKKSPSRLAIKGTTFEELGNEPSKADSRIEEMQIRRSNRGSSRAREVSSKHNVSDSDEDLPLSQIARTQPKTRVLSDSDEDLPLAQVARAQPKTQPVSSTSGSSAQRLITAAPTKDPTTALSSSAVRPPASSRPSSIGASRETPRPRGGLNNRAGKLATRGGPSMARNVFETGEPAKRRGNLLKNATKPSIDPKVFGIISHRRKAELQGRDMAERAPDLGVLGGLIDPSKPASIQPVKPSDLRKLSSSTSNQAGLDRAPGRSDLFLSRNETPNPEIPENYLSVPARQTLHQPTRSRRPVCFFWDRQQRHIGGPCQNGESCHFEHTYHYGLTVAAAPDLWVSPAAEPSLPTSKISKIPTNDVANFPTGQDPVSTSSVGQEERKPRPLICFFWDRWMKNARNPPCVKRSSCTRDHTYEHGQLIAGPPPGFKFPSSDRFPPPLPQRNNPSTDEDTDVPFSGSIQATSLTGQVQKITKPAPSVSSASDLPSDKTPYLHTYIGGFPIGSAVCFFWDQNQKNNKCPPCADGPVNCMYRHSYGENAPIAPAPPHYKHPYPTARPQWNPENSRNAICYFFFNGRECDMSTCSFFHSMEPGMPIAPLPEEQVVHATTRMDQENHSYTQSASSVNQEDSVLNDTPAIANAQPVRPLTLPRALPPTTTCRELPTRPSAISNRPAWDPRDPHKAVCYFWYKGSCKRQMSCNYIHDLNPIIPISPPPWDHTAAKTCPLWAEGRCSKTARDCYNLHEYVDPAPRLRRGSSSNSRAEEVFASTNHLLIRPRKKSVKFADDPIKLTEELPSMSLDHLSLDQQAPAFTIPANHVACRFFKAGAGYCENGASCQFVHDYPKQPDTIYVNNKPSPIREMSTSVPSDVQPRPETLSKTVDKDVDMLGSNVSQPEFGNQSHAASPNFTMKPISKSNSDMFKMGELASKKLTGRLGAMTKEVVFGSDEAQSLSLNFGDLELDKPDRWKLTLTSESKIILDQICLAQDVRLQQGLITRQVLWCGSLTAADPEHLEMLKSIDQAVDELALCAAGLVSTFAGFAILIFPSRKKEWRFLEDSARYSSDDAPLRYMIFRHENNFNRSRNSPSRVEFGKPFRKLLMDRVHGLRLNSLVPKYGKDQNPFKFYLLFPRSEEQSLDFFSAWIRSSNAESQIFDSRTKGSWDFFVKNHEGYGVIFIHDSLIGTISQLHSVSKLLKSSSIWIWDVSDSTSLYPRFPSILREPESELGTIKFTRLFPHGCAFLLTPSFLIAEPELSYDLLKWFFLKSQSSTPGTWKLVCCSKLNDYILDLADAKVMEKEAFEKTHRDNPARESMLKQKKLSYDHCELRYKSHTLLAQAKGTIYPLGHGDGDSDSDSGFNEDMDGPIVEAPNMIDPDDEEQLVRWFAAWSMQKLDVHRKFGIIGTNQENAVRATRLKLKPPTKPLLSVQKQKAREIADKYCKPTAKKLDHVETLELTANFSDSSMAMDLDHPVISKHGIDINQPEDVLEFIRQTGSDPEDAKRYLAKANNNVSNAVQMYKHEDRDEQVVDVINSERRRPLPPLVIKDSDLERTTYNDAANRTKQDTKLRGAGHDTYGKVRGRSESNNGGVFDTNKILIAQQPACKTVSTGLEVEAGDSIRFIKFVSGKRHYAMNLRTNERGQVHEDLFHPEPTAMSHDQTRSSLSNKRPSSVIATDTFVLSSLSSIETDRPEHPVRPSFAPKEDKEVYKSQRTIDQTPQEESVAVGSKNTEVSDQRSSLDSVSLTSNESVRPPKRARRERPDRAYETKEFRATSAWYSELYEAGQGWEYIAVLTDWAEAKKYLQFK